MRSRDACEHQTLHPWSYTLNCCCLQPAVSYNDISFDSNLCHVFFCVTLQLCHDHLKYSFLRRQSSLLVVVVQGVLFSVESYIINLTLFEHETRRSMLSIIWEYVFVHASAFRISPSWRNALLQSSSYAAVMLVPMSFFATFSLCQSNQKQWTNTKTITQKPLFPSCFYYLLQAMGTGLQFESDAMDTGVMEPVH